jgi:hypothetical protein
MKRTRITLTALALFAVALCALPTSRANETKPAKNVTFNKDVAPIFFKNCAECHRPGEAAPFSVLSYKDARPWAKSIREKVASRAMPPWHANSHFGAWANDPRLTQTEIDTITAWVDGGAKEGAAKDLPPLPQFVEGWNIGKPDLIIPLPEEFTLAANGPDEYQYFEVDPGFKQDVFVQLAEARPGNRCIVHHIIAFIQPPPKNTNQAKLSQAEQEKLRAEQERLSISYKEGFLIRTKADAPVYDDGCALPNGGLGQRRDLQDKPANEDATWLVGFAPGAQPMNLPPGTAIRIPAGSKIRFQMHYSKVAGSVQKDRSSVGIIFAKQPPAKELKLRPVINRYFQIPAGAANQRVTACWTVPNDIHALFYAPHMHVRGRSQRIEALYPDGRSEVLLDVPNYDFAWQTAYEPQTPKALPQGTRILVTSTFDNSARNKFNPDPTQAVRFGEPTYDEMMIGFIGYTKDTSPVKPAATVSGGQTPQ